MDGAIEELRALVPKAEDDDERFHIISRISDCLRLGGQKKQLTELWKQSVELFDTRSSSVMARLQFARAMFDDGMHEDARNLVVSQLDVDLSGEDKAGVYRELAHIEDGMGNATLAVYCKDKAQEYLPNDRSGLFDAAYSASEDKADHIALSNYIILSAIDARNATVPNNLGVYAQNQNLNSIAVKKYKESEGLDNTLAMANRGFMLTNAGFVEEALELANRAMAYAEPHINVHSLFEHIERTKNEQNKKWDEQIELANKWQKYNRKFVEKYYLSRETNVVGIWRVGNSENMATVSVSGEIVQMTWTNDVGQYASYDFVVSGVWRNSGFVGEYKCTPKDRSKVSLLGSLETHYKCLGFVSGDGNDELIVLSEDYSKDKLIYLYRIDGSGA